MVSATYLIAPRGEVTIAANSPQFVHVRLTMLDGQQNTDYFLQVLYPFELCIEPLFFRGRGISASDADFTII